MRRMFRAPILFFVALLLLIAQCAAVARKGSGERTGSTIKIGFIASLTGMGAKDGPAMVKGMQLYLSKAGYRMAGKKVELLVEDDQGNVDTAILKARKLLSKDKVDVLTGVIYSPIAYAVAPIADEMQTPFVVSTSTADDLTQRRRSKWVLRVCSTSSQIAMPMGEYARKQLHYKKVVTIGCNYAHSWEVVAGFHKSFEDNGGQIIQKLWLPMDDGDFSSALAKINADADAVFLALVGTPARAVPRQLHALRPKLPIIASSATLEENIMPEIGQYVIGAISSNNHCKTLAFAPNQQFVGQFRAKYCEDASIYSRGAYIAASWIDHAVQQVGGNVANKESFLAALKNVKLDSVNGPIAMDKYGGIIEDIYIRQVRNARTRVENVVIYTYPHVSQFWKYNPKRFLAQPVFDKAFPPCTHCRNEP